MVEVHGRNPLTPLIHRIGCSKPPLRQRNRYHRFDWDGGVVFATRETTERHCTQNSTPNSLLSSLRANGTLSIEFHPHIVGFSYPNFTMADAMVRSAFPSPHLSQRDVQMAHSSILPSRLYIGYLSQIQFWTQIWIFFFGYVQSAYLSQTNCSIHQNSISDRLQPTHLYWDISIPLLTLQMLTANGSFTSPQQALHWAIISLNIKHHLTFSQCQTFSPLLQ